MNKILSIRIYAILSHFLLTTVLIWTRIDSIQVTMSTSDSDNVYKIYNENYTSMLAFALVLLIARFLLLFFNIMDITAISIFNIILDGIACLFNAWSALDGLAWYNYSYIFVFCVWVLIFWLQYCNFYSFELYFFVF